ncbi:MAG: hypothetical protein SXQ77_11200, partial [Halobacteria archaeon]|nr:hypothetical protein [Halobacteria archaeon]
ALKTLTLVTALIGFVALGGTSRNVYERAGLLLVGIFGALAAVSSPPLIVVAVGGTVVGGFVAVGANIRRDLYSRRLVAAVVLAGVAVSLAGSLGYEASLLRRVGTDLALLGVFLSPIFVVGVEPEEGITRPALVGITAAVLVFYAGLKSPFVMRAVVLVGGGVIGASLIAVFVAGGVTTVTAGIRNRNFDAAVGGGLLLLAGVPSTVTRALSVVLGLVLLAKSRRLYDD